MDTVGYYININSLIMCLDYLPTLLQCCFTVTLPTILKFTTEEYPPRNAIHIFNIESIN